MGHDFLKLAKANTTKILSIFQVLSRRDSLPDYAEVSSSSVTDGNREREMIALEIERCIIFL